MEKELGPKGFTNLADNNYTRTIELTAEVDATTEDATHKDGVLTCRSPAHGPFFWQRKP